MHQHPSPSHSPRLPLPMELTFNPLVLRIYRVECLCFRVIMATPGSSTAQTPRPKVGRPRRSHTLEFKAIVIKDFLAGSLGVNACARKHGISESTLRTFVKQKEDILRSVRTFGSSSDAST